ncbi:ferredoxin reductase family protein [Vibrio sp. SCSIO 43137]|uniref:ferredoxin reductase family protein n=1 Tax=Vibrio sp. SCSIO 43137 TaxID=3021011 RepID=UPI002306E44C|nr:ferric reductase-like transmembrane domain-containing protein [Vibrio sp. SCSIO 43137]WCE31672.1 ferric reductase-like transmembrane domain-containing protein [Vibrio sp. SCSIO 43137]
MPKITVKNITLLVALLWLPSVLPTLISEPQAAGDFFFWRHQLTMLTGFLALAYMSLAVLLAVRFRWVEEIVKELDKGYALHKSLGIAALISLISHWAMVKSAMWLIDSGMIAMPDRGPRPEQTGVDWRGIAEGVGDVSFKIFLLFSIFSLVQAISYKRFRFVHKIGGVLMLAGVFHTMLLLDWNIAALPMNIAVTGLCMIASYCSVWSLSGKIGRRNRSSGQVIASRKLFESPEKGNIIRFSVRLDETIGYKEGQFAYLNFHDGEAPHPFSILNYREQEKLIDFGVKDLGDYTHKLVNTLRNGQKVTVEGGYGHFQISGAPQQVWIGAGIGIVPMISRLYWLSRKAAKGEHKLQSVHLFYCVNSEKEAFFRDEITSLIGNLLNRLDFIKFELVDAEKGELLGAERVYNAGKELEFDISFCGPHAFADQLKSGLTALGFDPERFHREQFKMR